MNHACFTDGRSFKQLQSWTSTPAWLWTRDQTRDQTRPKRGRLEKPLAETPSGLLRPGEAPQGEVLANEMQQRSTWKDSWSSRSTLRWSGCPFVDDPVRCTVFVWKKPGRFVGEMCHLSFVEPEDWNLNQVEVGRFSVLQDFDRHQIVITDFVRFADARGSWDAQHFCDA